MRLISGSSEALVASGRNSEETFVLHTGRVASPMKKIAKRVIPVALVKKVRVAQSRWRVRREFAQDRDRYARNMMLEDHLAHYGMSGRNLEAQLTKDYHRIEKGLALAAPRQPFGAAVSSRLDYLLPHAENAGAFADHAATARAALHRWNAEGAIDDEISPLRAPASTGLNDADAFFGSRHSVRDFADVEVPQELIERAVGLAINTPSVCNRQSWRMRVFHGADASKVLRFQNGSRGFADNVPAVALVTVDTRMFTAAGERNQAWIEGGLFSMTFVWACHALGLDTCMLNMSVTNEKARRLRARYDIEDAEVIIMMIAVGFGREGHRRARSPRRAIADVLVTDGDATR